MAQNLISQLRKTVWIPTWGTFGALGLCDKITPKLTMVTKPIKVGTLGADLEIGERFIGLQGMITTDLREPNQALILALMPWNGSTVPGGGILLQPAANVDLFSYAATLRLHPFDQASSNAEDLVLTNAVPKWIYELERGTANDDVAIVGWKIYPTRTSLPTAPNTVLYGTAGAA